MTTLSPEVLEKARSAGAQEAHEAMAEDDVWSPENCRAHVSEFWAARFFDVIEDLGWVMEQCGLPREPVDEAVIQEWGAAYTEGANEECEAKACEIEHYRVNG